jgi:Uma2 family endonuclease
MSTALEYPETHYTYADVLEWDEDVRAEIIDGEIYMMAPPFRNHQELLTKLLVEIANFLKGKPCKVYPAPFGVRLFPKKDNTDDTFLEPDIVVVCDSSKLDKRGCNGAPDLVIEILSPSTTRKDRIVKFNKYQQAGVREYWLVDGDEKNITVYTLEDKRFVASLYEAEETVKVSVLPGCEIDLKDIF